MYEAELARGSAWSSSIRADSIDPDRQRTRAARARPSAFFTQTGATALPILGRRIQIAEDVAFEIGGHFGSGAGDGGIRQRLAAQRSLDRRCARWPRHQAADRHRRRRARAAADAQHRGDADHRVARRRMLELHVRHALPGGLRRHLDRRQQIVLTERRRHHAGEELVDGDRPAVRRPLVTTKRAPSAVSTVGRSDAGSACATLPPIVPRLRTAGSPTCPAASASAGHCSRSTADAASSACVVNAPIRTMPPFDVDALQLADPADVDERRRRRQPQLQQRNRACGRRRAAWRRDASAAGACLLRPTWRGSSRIALNTLATPACGVRVDLTFVAGLGPALSRPPCPMPSALCPSLASPATPARA